MRRLCWPARDLSRWQQTRSLPPLPRCCYNARSITTPSWRMRWQSPSQPSMKKCATDTPICNLPSRLLALHRLLNRGITSSQAGRTIISRPSRNEIQLRRNDRSLAPSAAVFRAHHCDKPAENTRLNLAADNGFLRAKCRPGCARP